MPKNKGVIYMFGLAFIGALFAFSGWVFFDYQKNTPSYTTEESGFEEFENTEEEKEDIYLGFGNRYTLTELESWKREEGPFRVGIQVGHLDNEFVPEELEGLKRNRTGATWKTLNERDTVKIIAEHVRDILVLKGIEVEILPATVPPGFLADAFVSIHADGNSVPSVSGFKIGSPRRDYSGKSIFLKDFIDDSYEEVTGLKKDENVTRRMSGYYAFNWWRYEHAIHPLTPAVIVETGFLTSAADRRVIVYNPKRAAEGIVNGIISFLESGVLEQDTEGDPLLPPTFPLIGEYRCIPFKDDSIPDPLSCKVGIKAPDERIYALDLSELSEIPLLVPKDIVSLSGVFIPLQALSSMEWYRYEIEGIIRAESIRKEETFPQVMEYQ